MLLHSVETNESGHGCECEAGGRIGGGGVSLHHICKIMNSNEQKKEIYYSRHLRFAFEAIQTSTMHLIPSNINVN